MDGETEIGGVCDVVLVNTGAVKPLIPGRPAAQQPAVVHHRVEHRNHASVPTVPGVFADDLYCTKRLLPVNVSAQQHIGDVRRARNP